MFRVGVAAVALTVLTACGQPPPTPWASPKPSTAAPPTAAPAASRAAAPPVQVKQTPAITYPARGHRRGRAAPASPRPAGRSGNLLRYRVLVESDITGLHPASFGEAVTATLNDPSGWTGGGTLRLLRVGPGQPYDFTVYLATPRTRDGLCGSGPDAYTSCRKGDKVVLNVARWVKGVPGYGAPLPVYRQYMVNHEVGHRLGHGHERCPGRGQPAPVMQQQTLGLHGCTPNPWPYRGGERYSGAPGVYDDPVPKPDSGRPA